MDDETKLAAPRKVQRDGDRVLVSLPEEAVEHSGLTVGDETMVAYREDGPIVLVPWARDDVVDMFREDREVDDGDVVDAEDEDGADAEGEGGSDAEAERGVETSGEDRDGSSTDGGDEGSTDEGSGRSTGRPAGDGP